MKYKLLILMVVFIGCKHKKANSPVVEASKKVDSLITQSKDISDQTDSLKLALTYFTKEMDAKSMRDEYEIKYLRTGEDKYRILGNLYADSIHYWYLKLASVTKKPSP